jgi:hypothetical protein
MCVGPRPRLRSTVRQHYRRTRSRACLSATTRSRLLRDSQARSRFGACLCSSEDLIVRGSESVVWDLPPGAARAPRGLNSRASGATCGPWTGVLPAAPTCQLVQTHAALIQAVQDWHSPVRHEKVAFLCSGPRRSASHHSALTHPGQPLSIDEDHDVQAGTLIDLIRCPACGGLTAPHTMTVVRRGEPDEVRFRNRCVDRWCAGLRASSSLPAPEDPPLQRRPNDSFEKTGVAE